MAEERTDTYGEFYVGYLPQAPPELARLMRKRVLVILALALGTSILLTATQRPVSTAHFEFGNDRSFEGWIVEHPYPHLVVERPGQDAGVSRWMLTVYGKRGAGHAVEGLDGERVRLEGQLMYRDDRTMIDVLPESIEVIEGPPSMRAGPLLADQAGEAVPWRRDMGTQTLRGEIVDSKCFLGVMKPGNLKPHRACATRCISGGIPPVLLVRDEAGEAKYFMLVSAEGGTVNADVLDRIAEPLEITGRVVQIDDLVFLFADPATYTRIE